MIFTSRGMILWGRVTSESCVPMPFTLMLVLMFYLAGCAKKPADQTAPALPLSTSEAAPTGPLSPPATPQVIAPAEDGKMDATLAQLTQVLRRFGAENRRVPQSLNEVVAAGYLAALPAVPAGKEFAIDAKRMQVVLANK
jgi:hypothetical protein